MDAFLIVISRSPEDDHLNMNMHAHLKTTIPKDDHLNMNTHAWKEEQHTGHYLANEVL